MSSLTPHARMTRIETLLLRSRILGNAIVLHLIHVLFRISIIPNEWSGWWYRLQSELFWYRALWFQMKRKYPKLWAQNRELDTYVNSLTPYSVLWVNWCVLHLAFQLEACFNESFPSREEFSLVEIRPYQRARWAGGERLKGKFWLLFPENGWHLKSVKFCHSNICKVEYKQKSRKKMIFIDRCNVFFLDMRKFQI